MYMRVWTSQKVAKFSNYGKTNFIFGFLTWKLPEIQIPKFIGHVRHQKLYFELFTPFCPNKGIVTSQQVAKFRIYQKTAFIFGFLILKLVVMQTFVYLGHIHRQISFFNSYPLLYPNQAMMTSQREKNDLCVSSRKFSGHLTIDGYTDFYANSFIFDSKLIFFLYFQFNMENIGNLNTLQTSVPE